MAGLKLLLATAHSQQQDGDEDEVVVPSDGNGDGVEEVESNLTLFLNEMKSVVDDTESELETYDLVSSVIDQMEHAGSDNNPTLQAMANLVLGAEVFNQDTVLQGIGERLKRGKDYMVDLVKRLIKRIKASFKKVFGVTVNQERRVKKLLKLVDKKGSVNNIQYTLNAKDVITMTYDDKVLTDLTEVKDKLFMLSGVKPLVTDVFNAKSYEGSDTLVPSKFGKVIPSANAGTTIELAKFLNNQRLLVRFPAGTDNAKLGTSESAKSAAGTRAYLDSGDNKAIKKENKQPTPSLEEITALLEAIESNLTQVNQLEELIETMEAGAIDGFKEIAKNKDIAGSEAEYASRFVVSMGVTVPSSILSNTLRNALATHAGLMNVVTKALSCYKKSGD